MSSSSISRPSLSPPSNSPTTLISFYEESGCDAEGRKLSDILQWGVYELEGQHDYIQTLFPLPEESSVTDAPIIDRQVFEAFRSRPELRSKLRESFKKMLWFYGFELDAEGGSVTIHKGDNWTENFSNWDVRMDHNHLRITRIIRCLRVLGLEDEAHAFRAALEEYTTEAGYRSREYWRRAAQRSLNLRPDMSIVDESTDTIGPEFLQEFEQKRKAMKAAEMEQAIESESTDSGSRPPAKKQKSHSKHADNGSDKNEYATRVGASAPKP